MKKICYQAFAILAALASPLSDVHACTDFLLKAVDGTLINGRSMEFALQLDSNVTLHSRGEKNQGAAPNNQPGLQWTSRYGYICVTTLGLDLPVDGLNEKGLSMGFLWLPGTAYQQVPEGKYEQALAIENAGKWILGNFSTVAEVKEAINDVYIWGHPFKQLNNEIPPLHISLHDLQGNSLVVEFQNGRQKIYENPVNVLTNYPPFDWQLINLGNYVSLKAANAGPVTLGGLTVNPVGQGSGLFGIPGDWTPPARFVRTVALKALALPAKNATEGVNLAVHLINAVDIPKGDIRVTPNKPEDGDYTQWVVIKDLTNGILYYRTYQDLALHKIDFAKLNSAPGATVLNIPMSTTQAYVDDTQKLMK